jgi:hypothetical protein
LPGGRGREEGESEVATRRVSVPARVTMSQMKISLSAPPEANKVPLSSYVRDKTADRWPRRVAYKIIASERGRRWEEERLTTTDLVM